MTHDTCAASEAAEQLPLVVFRHDAGLGDGEQPALAHVVDDDLLDDRAARVTKRLEMEINSE